MNNAKRIITFISGGGTTNLEVLKSQRLGGELYGLVKTVAIVSSNAMAGGITKTLKFGFSGKYIHVVDCTSNLDPQLLKILNYYKPNAFHQMGWEPWTPDRVRQKYIGFNQHVGPGGRFMYYQRRVLAHQEFCKKIGKKRPIPIFIQYVGKGYDEGDAIYAEYYIDFSLDEDPE